MLKNFLKKIVPWIDESQKIINLYYKSHKAYKKGKNQLAYYYAYKISKKYRCYISPEAEIGKNILFPHPTGIVIGAGVKIGNDVTIYQNVTLGRKKIDIAEYPTIGNNVTIYCSATIIGKILIGDNSVIGCNSVILRSVEKNSNCVGVVK